MSLPFREAKRREIPQNYADKIKFWGFSLQWGTPIVARNDIPQFFITYNFTTAKRGII